jgi:hypothetical protein
VRTITPRSRLPRNQAMRSASQARSAAIRADRIVGVLISSPDLILIS